MTELELEIERAEKHYRNLQRATKDIRDYFPNGQPSSIAASMINSAEQEEFKALQRLVTLEEIRESVIRNGDNADDLAPAKGMLLGAGLSTALWGIAGCLVLLIAPFVRRFL